MTKYYLPFIFLFLVSLLGIYLIDIEEAPPSVPVASQDTQQTPLHRFPVLRREKRVASVQQRWEEMSDGSDAPMRAWKEKKYTSYRPLIKEKRPEKKRVLASRESKHQTRRQHRETIVSKGIKYVRIPFKGKYIYVSSDYYSAGGIRKPLSLKQARKVARQHGAVLPTKEMVDAIWKYADLKLKPQPLQAGPLMTQPIYFVKHDRMIEQQINHRSFDLVAGHKKDIIVPERSGRVTIYGWHRLNGTPIQPPSNVHDDDYGDYANCLRLVKLHT